MTRGRKKNSRTEEPSVKRKRPAGEKPSTIDNRKSTIDNLHWLTIVGARHNNLRNLTVRFPLARFVAVTGVSGSGKSSLVNDILREALARDLNGAENVHPGAHERIDGSQHLDKIIDIDQSPIGRTPRSNPATYIKVFDEIRSLYTQLPDAKVRGYKPGRFSFNVSTGQQGGGRCEACEGNGSNRMEMDFLADIWVTCPVCTGKRFNHETLQILYRGKSITDVLEMDVQQALDHFVNHPKIAGMLRTLHDVGLDYLKLGQSSTTLSGGEAQRIKLARELVKRSTGRTLYVLDEPTTGLHFADIKRLLTVLHGFVDAGNTVVVIEHNLDVIKTADWVIDLGPEGGAGGGRLVAEGTPEEVAKEKESYTGVALREVLDEKSRKVEKSKSRNNLSRRLQPARSSNLGNATAIESISVFGAKQHNLKDINVEFPRGAMTVCCGPSGSGKSSFAVDTVYAEGQRRYVESLSAYARQFLSRMQPPRVEKITGLSPAICIEQKNTTRSPRSTVGTITEIYDYMRVLWARLGVPHCPRCRTPIGTQTSDEIVERLLALGEGTRVLLLAPVTPTGQETYEQLLTRERANGYLRARIDGTLHEIAAPIELDRRREHRVEIVVDRVVVHRAKRGRLAESVEQALAMGNGILIAAVVGESRVGTAHLSAATDPGVEKSKNRKIETTRAAGFSPRDGANERQQGDNGVDLRFSQHHSCQICGTAYEELSPHHFTFNSRLGWCEACEGLGVQQGAAPSAIILHPTRSILEGALAGWENVILGSKLHTLILALSDHIGLDPNRAWNQLTEPQRLAIMHGCGDAWITVYFGQQRGTADSSLRGSVAPWLRGFRFQWHGFFPAIARATRSSWQYRQRLEHMAAEVSCDTCAGSRLRPESATARFSDATIHEICLKPLDQALAWFSAFKLSARERKVAGELLHEITSRLRFLVDVGLNYVSLHRSAATLSGGEAQRIQLAAQIGTGLTGVLYVLDEPTIGLHPRDNRRLIGALKRLRDLGNTLLLVEHDREVIDAADHVLDFGPGAGTFGGEVTASASPKKLRKDRQSLTGKYLSGAEAIAVPSNRRPVGWALPTAVGSAIADPEPRASARAMVRSEGKPAKSGSSRRLKPAAQAAIVNLQSPISNPQWLTVLGARENNLKEIDVAFPLGRFVCVTGVSGSGKSSLVGDILYPALAARLHRAGMTPGGHEKITGMELIDKVINIDQSPIGNSPTSNPATYTGLFDNIRELYAKLPLSKIRGYTANRFSFNRSGGRCEACEGMGQRCIEMHFLPDVWVECESCKGARYVPETLEVKYRDKSIADVLDMRVSAALTIFENVPRIHRLLQTLDDVGLGYVALGQSAPTLSGGEAQRVKLAAELGRPSTGKTLYLLDEPTTGLHFDDLKKLLGVLHRLVDLGNSVICVEHNLDVIKTADWVIDLGPDGGDAGGQIVIAGTPEAVAKAPESFTGIALRPVLAAGPIAERPVHSLANSPRRKLGASENALPLDVENLSMPWERDGRKWHLENPTDFEGAPVAWDPQVLAWLVESIESLGKFTPANWNHRTLVEITGAGKVPWLCHFRTGGNDLLDVAIRVKEGSFELPTLTRELAVKSLDERVDLPIYGQWSRISIRRARDGWEEVRLHLRDFVDVNKSVFRKFLQRAVAGYFAALDESSAPEVAEPWITQGQQWHLSQRSIHPKHEKQWRPEMLIALIGKFNSLEKNLRFDWAARTAGQFTVPGETAPAGKIVTNLGRGLRVELRTPRGAITPAMVDRLGEDIEIKPGPDYDRLCFWVKSLNQIDTAQLREAWRLCRSNKESLSALVTE